MRSLLRTQLIQIYLNAQRSTSKSWVPSTGLLNALARMLRQLLRFYHNTTSRPISNTTRQPSTFSSIYIALLTTESVFTQMPAVLFRYLTIFHTTMTKKPTPMPRHHVPLTALISLPTVMPVGVAKLEMLSRTALHWNSSSSALCQVTLSVWLGDPLLGSQFARNTLLSACVRQKFLPPMNVSRIFNPSNFELLI